MFGTRVRARRKLLGLSQEDLARKAGVDVKTVRGIENGRRRPRLSTVRQLADALGLEDAVRDQFYAAASPDAAEEAFDQPYPAPAQLPLDVPGFTGRQEQLNALDEVAEEASEQPTAVIIAAVRGTAGVGKTALALHWAHLVRHRFPDGQLYLNLRGFDPAGSPMSASEAIRRFLEALDVTPRRIPVDLDAQAALYRTLLSGRRMLIVLDNARDADQVRPLLPGAPGCLVLITSRHQMTGLVVAENAHLVPLDLLTSEEARDLLSRRLGAGRATAEPDAVDEIVNRCAGLPLALAIVAARAAVHPQLSLASLAAGLRDADEPLDNFSTGDSTTDVRAVFSWSYRTLVPDAARVFRLLGVHSGPDISGPAAASLTGIPLAEVRPLLNRLTQAHLLTEHLPGRYTFHDLLRAYATELACRVEADNQLRLATHRILDHYLHSAYAATRLLDPYRDAIRLNPPQPGVTPESPADHEQALAWFTAEHATLLAATRHAASAGWDGHAWQQAWALATFLERRGHWHDQVTVQHAAVSAARRSADPGSQALADRILARAYINLGRCDDARTRLRNALSLYRRSGDQAGQAHTHINLGIAYARRGRHTHALRHARQAHDLFRAAGHLRGQAIALSACGWYYAQLRDYRQALAASQDALLLHQESGDHAGEAHTWDTVGYVHHQLGHHARAIACYQRGLDLFRHLADRYEEATTLVRLGHTHHTAGNADAARHAWEQAIIILDALDHPDAEQIRATLGSLDRAAGTQMTTAAS